MDWKFIFLSFQGRLNRKPYWLGTIAILSLIIIGVFGVTFLAGGGGGVVAIGVIYLLLLWPTLAISVKRLHDRDKSAWWLVVFYVVPALLNVLGEAGDGDGVGAIIFGLGGLAISIWALVELGFLRGTVGANRFGPDPLAPPAA